MTLFKQINSLLFALFLLVMSTLVYFQYTHTRDFMNQQSNNDLTNTMIALELALRPHIDVGDKVSAEILLNVFFDGGLYRKISLTWLEDNTIQTREKPDVEEGFSSWLMDIQTFTQTRVITSQWMQLATLEVETDPALANKQLQRVMNDTLMIVSLLFLLSILLVRLRLNVILKPLHDIATQVKGIGQRNFNQNLETPKTSELKDVVTAINAMSGQLKQVFNSLDSEVSELKGEKLIDHVSQLPNRQYLTAQLHNWLNEPGFGGLILAKFDWLDDIHSKYGYQGRDAIIKTVAGRMQAELSAIAPGVIARIANTEFAFLLTKAQHQDIEKYLSTLIRIINQEITKAGCEANSRFALGVSQRIDNMQPCDLLSQSDNALQQALQTGSVSHWIDAQQIQKYNREQWREKLEHAIYNNQFDFHWQAVNNLQGNDIIQREIYCRLTIQGETISAAEFMPFIELFLLGNQLDKCLLQSIEAQSIMAHEDKPVAINLTHDSIQDPEFAKWLAIHLGSSKYAHKMFFEIPESAVINDYGACQRLAHTIDNAGAKLGIDHCGRHMGSLEYLNTLQPHYIKLDPSYAFYEKQNLSNEMCRALINVARGLNIEVIITGIESTELLEKFSSLRVQGYQGYIIPPQEIFAKAETVD